MSSVNVKCLAYFLLYKKIKFREFFFHCYYHAESFHRIVTNIILCHEFLIFQVNLFSNSGGRKESCTTAYICTHLRTGNRPADCPVIICDVQNTYFRRSFEFLNFVSAVIFSEGERIIPYNNNNCSKNKASPGIELCGSCRFL